MANDPPSATAQEITIDEKGDVILVVGKDPHQGRIQVSTMLLAMYSSVFRTIFQGPWKEAVHFALAVKSQNPYQLELPEDLFEPTTFLCEILYHQAVMPKAIHHSTSASKEVCDEQLETAEREAERMASFITVCDKYAIIEPCSIFLGAWITNLANWFEQLHSAKIHHTRSVEPGFQKHIRQSEFNARLTQLMFSICLNSLMINNSELFQRLSKSLLLSTGSLRSIVKTVQSGNASLYGLKAKELLAKTKSQILVQRMKMHKTLSEHFNHVLYGPKGLDMLKPHGYGDANTYCLGQHDLQCFWSCNEELRQSKIGDHSEGVTDPYLPVGSDILGLSQLRKKGWGLLDWEISNKVCYGCNNLRSGWQDAVDKILGQVEAICWECITNNFTDCVMHEMVEE